MGWEQGGHTSERVAFEGVHFERTMRRASSIGMPDMLQQLAKCSGMSLPTKDDTNNQIWPAQRGGGSHLHLQETPHGSNNSLPRMRRRRRIRIGRNASRSARKRVCVGRNLFGVPAGHVLEEKGCDRAGICLDHPSIKEHPHSLIQHTGQSGQGKVWRWGRGRGRIEGQERGRGWTCLFGIIWKDLARTLDHGIHPKRILPCPAAVAVSASHSDTCMGAKRQSGRVWSTAGTVRLQSLPANATLFQPISWDCALIIARPRRGSPRPLSWFIFISSAGFSEI